MTLHCNLNFFIFRYLELQLTPRGKVEKWIIWHVWPWDDLYVAMTNRYAWKL